VEKPVGVIPFPVEGRGADTTVVIACSKEAKAAGCRNVMPVRAKAQRAVNPATDLPVH
jgi:DNA polymerase-4